MKCTEECLVWNTRGKSKNLTRATRTVFIFPKLNHTGLFDTRWLDTMICWRHIMIATSLTTLLSSLGNLTDLCSIYLKVGFHQKVMLSLSVLITALKFVLLLVLSRGKSARLVTNNPITSVKYKSWADFICRVYSVLWGSVLRYGKMGNKKKCNLSCNVAATIKRVVARFTTHESNLCCNNQGWVAQSMVSFNHWLSSIKTNTLSRY